MSWKARLVLIVTGLYSILLGTPSYVEGECGRPAKPSLPISLSLNKKKKNFLSAFSSLVGRDESRISHILFSDSELDTRKLDTNTNLGFPGYRHEMDTQRDRVGNG